MTFSSVKELKSFFDFTTQVDPLWVVEHTVICTMTQRIQFQVENFGAGV